MLQTYLALPARVAAKIAVIGFPLHLGWHEQGDGKFFYGISVQNGRIKDDGEFHFAAPCVS